MEIHVTPYQIEDEQRPWIGKEEKIFSGLLKKLGAETNRVVHFKEEPPTLENHFRILDVFR